MRRRPPHPHEGFTLVEVIVALVLLTIGVLGLAGVARSVTRLTTESLRLTTAAVLAGSRVEQLRAGGCVGALSGTAVTGAYAESWSASGAGAARAVRVTVTYPAPPGLRMRALAAVIACALDPPSGAP
jgi:type IV pilus modification protein PilV